jgi:predicted dehydrogenase
MEKKKLKIYNVAIIGGGLNSAVGSAHFSALHLTNRFNIIAGAFSRKNEINFDTARAYHISENRVYNDYKTLIKNEKNNVDCMIILTPTDQHLEQVLECISNGIPVICEKALAGSVADIVKIQNEFNLSNGFLSVIYNYLGYPILRELKSIIQSNGLGAIQQIQIEMPQEGFLKIIDGKPMKPQDWRLNDKNIPVISLDLGVHLHMIIKYLTGEMPVRAVSSAQSYGNFSAVVDNVNCIIQYTNNIICNMWYSKVAIGQRNGLRVRIFGTTGSAEWFQLDPEILNMANNEGHRWILDRGSDGISISNLPRYTRFKVGHPAGFIEALANYYEDIANDLQNYLECNTIHSVKDSFGIEESLEGMKLFHSIFESSISGSWSDVRKEDSFKLNIL